MQVDCQDVLSIIQLDEADRPDHMGLIQVKTNLHFVSKIHELNQIPRISGCARFMYIRRNLYTTTYVTCISFMI